MTTTNDQPITSESAAFTRAVADQVERSPLYNDGRVRITLGSAAVLTIVSSAATAIWVRRRARRKLAWYMLARAAANGAGAAMPAPRQVVPLGGAGGSALLLALAAARLRRAQQSRRSHDLNVRDLLLGVALGMGLVGMAGRRRG